MRNILALALASFLSLACGIAQDESDMAKPDLGQPRYELLAVVPLYIPAWDSRIETGGPIGSHRVQIVASGQPFDHVYPQQFHFWQNGQPADDLMSMTGCVTRTPNSVVCDVKPEDRARGGTFELCYGFGVCLPAALFVQQEIPR